MSENKWNCSIPESFSKVMEELNKVQLSASALAMSQAWKAAVPDYNFKGIASALEQYANATKGLSNVTLPTSSILGLTDAINAMHTVKMSSVAASVLPLIDTSAYAALVDTAGIKSALSSIDWSWLSEVHLEDYTENTDFPSMSEEEKLAPEIKAEIAADITEVIADPGTMHITSKKKFMEWVKESPEHALAFLTALLLFIQTICMVVSTWQARPVKDSQVYQEPVSSSNVVYNLTVENTVTVIGDVPYYYEVEFVNPETGESMIGYIYKGNLAAEEPEDAGIQEEKESEATEVPETIPDTTEELAESAE